MTAFETAAPWAIKGQEFVHCNCAYGCPCQLNPRPTAGFCQAVAGLYIEQGHYGATDLAGLSIALVASWTGPIAAGGGEALPIMDETADEEQRRALQAIVGELRAFPDATFFAVYPAAFARIHDPVFAYVGLVLDVEGRRALLKVPNLVEARGEPIVDKATGELERTRIDLPGGPPSAALELARGWASVTGPIAFETRDTHAQFSHLQLSGQHRRTLAA